MASLDSSPSAQIWLDDFQTVLALSPVTEHGVQGIVYFRHPDAGWADDYAFSLWHACRYLIRHSPEWEKSGLAVVGSQQGLVKESVLIALFAPFLGSAAERIQRLDFPPERIAACAKGIEKLYPP